MPEKERAHSRWCKHAKAGHSYPTEDVNVPFANTNLKDISVV
jgi:hypothetical protein